MTDLASRREQAETKFNELARQREQKQNELTEIDAELNRLQGEWRLIQDIELEATAEADKPAVSPDPATIDVVGAKKADKTNG